MSTRRQKKLTPVSVRMTDEMIEALQAIAEEERRSLSNLIVLALELFIHARNRLTDSPEATQK